LYDFTISAPKSVSVMATLGGDKRLIDAHEKAVDEALHELEEYSGTRIRQRGANADRTRQFIIHLREPFAQTKEVTYQPVVETSHDWGLE
jgi:conjugative relaxase-like TrwC/TraI family protein